MTRHEIARRVVNKEVLRRAFESVESAVSHDNVHGEFDDVVEWRTHRPLVEQWIAANADTVDVICRTVLKRTAMDEPAGIREMHRYVSTQLVAAIDDVAADSPDHHPLSQRLASNGILPMFGFPTTVRYLYHGGPPRMSGGWPPERGVVDRNLDIAISQFAPGAQTVKDDALLTSVGVADYFPSGGTVQAAPDPLGEYQRKGICRWCQALVEDPEPTGGCPTCGAPRGRDDYRTVDLSEPPGLHDVVADRGRVQRDVRIHASRTSPADGPRTGPARGSVELSRGPRIGQDLPNQRQRRRRLRLQEYCRTERVGRGGCVQAGRAGSAARAADSGTRPAVRRLPRRS